MKVVAVLLAIACFSLSVEAQNVICGAKITNKAVTVEDGDTFSFKTQKGKKYKGNTKCTVDYKMGDTCSKMSFVCTKFNTNNKDKKKCSKGDKVTVTVNGKPKAYCKTKKPKVISTGDMSVVFTSDKKKHGPGAVCKVKCTEAASGGTGLSSYSQAWLRGEGPYGHVHEGVRLEAGDGWVGVGDLIREESRPKKTQMMVRRINNAGKTVWTYRVGDSHTNAAKMSYSAGYSIAQSGDKLYVGGGIWQKQSNVMKPAVIALDVATGSVVWTKLLDSQPQNGGVRSVIVDGGRIICTGYVNYGQAGFVFVADEATPAVWELDTSGNLVTEKLLSVAGMGQGAKIRKDTTGYILTSTAWNEIGGQELNHAALVKLSDSLDVEWSKMFGMAGGQSQVFDMLVDKEGNYLLGGHTTVGSGVVNWDYLALKVNSQTRDVEWRKTFGQPRGFDARYIHDEMYGVALDPAGNYLLLGGSGDEYPYSATDSATGWQSDVWVSYLVVVDTNGSTLSEGVYGRKAGNNAGEWLSVDAATGEVMIYTDSDTDGGFGFLKLTPN